jgi:hypothetical protein
METSSTTSSCNAQSSPGIDGQDVSLAQAQQNAQLQLLIDADIKCFKVIADKLGLKKNYWDPYFVGNPDGLRNALLEAILIQATRLDDLKEQLALQKRKNTTLMNLMEVIKSQLDSAARDRDFYRRRAGFCEHDVHREEDPPCKDCETVEIDSDSTSN